jgi:hypothetical protein
MLLHCPPHRIEDPFSAFSRELTRQVKGSLDAKIAAHDLA